MSLVKLFFYCAIEQKINKWSMNVIEINFSMFGFLQDKHFLKNIFLNFQLQYFTIFFPYILIHPLIVYDNLYFHHHLFPVLHFYQSSSSRGFARVVGLVSESEQAWVYTHPHLLLLWCYNSCRVLTSSTIPRQYSSSLVLLLHKRTPNLLR